MNTDVFRADDPQVVARALDILHGGGLVAFPTDTVYGIGALAFDGRAIESIYVAKARPLEKAIPVLIGEVGDLKKIARELPEMANRLTDKFWPGALTILLLKRADLPTIISASDTVGVRVPNLLVARVLLRAAGPMAVTSANISGQESPRSADEVFRQLSGRIHLIIDGGETRGGIPSTVVDCTGTDPVIVRAGPITLEQIQAALF